MVGVGHGYIASKSTGPPGQQCLQGLPLRGETKGIRFRPRASDMTRRANTCGACTLPEQLRRRLRRPPLWQLFLRYQGLQGLPLRVTDHVVSDAKSSLGFSNSKNKKIAKLFCSTSRPNLHDLKALAEPVKMTYYKLKYIQIWSRNQAKTVRAPIFRLPWKELNFLITIGPSFKSFEDRTVNVQCSCA